MTLQTNSFHAAPLLVAALCYPLWWSPIVVAQDLTDLAIAPALITPALILQPRSFGHVIGDLLTQRILLQAADVPFEPVALPAADRIGVWFERRAPRVTADEQGRRWLVLQYQIINAPRTLVVVALPELTLAARSGRLLKVTPWPLSIGPLTPGQVFAEGALQAIQPDRAAIPVATAPMVWRLKASLAALALSLCAWPLWLLWRNRRDAQRLPFARAWRELKNLERRDRIEGHGGIDGNAAAWIALHRALNATAGSAAHCSADLFEQAPQLLSLHEQLDDFYAQSSARFFACAPLAQTMDLMRLCRALRRIERAS